MLFDQLQAYFFTLFSEQSVAVALIWPSTTSIAYLIDFGNNVQGIGIRKFDFGPFLPLNCGKIWKIQNKNLKNFVKMA